MSQDTIGHFDRLDEDGKVVGSYNLQSSEELLIGRDKNSWCYIHLEAPWISNRHFRLYSIIYDNETEPFVYAEDLSSNGNNTWLYKLNSSWESCVITSGTTFLLSHGDKIRFCDGTVLIYYSVWICQGPSSSQDVDELRDLERESFSNMIHLSERKLGVGGYATVYMAVDRWNKRQVACKVVKLEKHLTDHQASHHFKTPQHLGITGDEGPPPRKAHTAAKLWREVELLKALSHPNIVQLNRVFYTDSTLYLVEGLVAGGDLSSYIAQQGDCLEENDACDKVYQILKGLEYLHDQGIVHRDLKPDNVLLSVPSATARIILTDFGGAVRELRIRVKRLDSLCGTAGYAAPEVVGNNRLVPQAGYTRAVDLWSLGCLTSALFIGKSYFAPSPGGHDSRRSSVIIQTASAECDLSKMDFAPEWSNVEDRAKKFIKSLLCLDERLRPTAKEALLDPWFSAGYGKGSCERHYVDLVLNWKPTTPVVDFAEDLRGFFEAGTSRDDHRRRLLSNNCEKVMDKESSAPPHNGRLNIAFRAWKESGRGDFVELDATDRPSSVREQPDNYAFGRRAATKRHRSRSDGEDHAIRKAAWEENRGLISAKAYATRTGDLLQKTEQKKV